jgi:pimeloyl-ACP methyl ester carboxylesterase
MTMEPFTVNVPEARLARIRARLQDIEWPNEPEGGPGGPWAYGTPLSVMQELVAYWRDTYDWRAAERGLNRFPQFMADIDGQRLHFYHVKGSQGRKRPLLLIHGWPGSVVEFLHILEPLAHPERFGGRAEDGFDLVVPSLPGYGFSGKPAKPMSPRSAARLFDRLMTETLGHEGYLAQGGDWGSAIAGWLAFEGKGCKAAHLNMFGWRSPGIAPETADEKKAMSDAAMLFEAEGAYFRLQSTKPLTLAYAMEDNPAGVAAWILEKFKGWSDTGGDVWSAHSRDRVLTNIMIYLVTRTFGTSTWMYRGLFEDPGGAPLPPGARIERPVGIAAFPVDLIPFPPRSLVERHMNVVHWSDQPRGGHFAALEMPEALVAEVRAFGRLAGI